LFEDVQKIESSKEDQNQSIQLKEEEDDDDDEEEQQPQSSPDGELSYDHHHHHHNYSELELHTTLAAKFGGPLNPDCIDEDVLVNETKDDMELREYILMGQVPLIDTIFRYCDDDDDDDNDDDDSIVVVNYCIGFYMYRIDDVLVIYEYYLHFICS